MDQATHQKLLETTAFSPDELNTMWQNFLKLSAIRTADKIIDKVEFRIMMNASPNVNSPFIDALFTMFDRDGSGGIDFTEFALALAVYQNKARAVPEPDKQKLFFKLFDIDRDGEISELDLATNLKSCFAACFMSVSDADIAALVKTTFAKYQLTPKGTIDFASYSKMAFRL